MFVYISLCMFIVYIIFYMVLFNYIYIPVIISLICFSQFMNTPLLVLITLLVFCLYPAQANQSLSHQDNNLRTKIETLSEEDNDGTTNDSVVGNSDESGPGGNVENGGNAVNSGNVQNGGNVEDGDDEEIDLNVRNDNTGSGDDNTDSSGTGDDDSKKDSGDETKKGKTKKGVSMRLLALIIALFLGVVICLFIFYQYKQRFITYG